jgi:hypothetical protein
VLRFDAELLALRPWCFSSLGFDTAFLDVSLKPEECAKRGMALALGWVRSFWRGPHTSPTHKEQIRSTREVFRGLPTPHLIDQPAKKKHLLEFVRRVLSDLHRSPTSFELFSADSYYSCHTKKSRSNAVITGIELDEGRIRRAMPVTRRLGLQHITFQRDEVRAFLRRSSERYDLVLCAGGLYHTSDPAGLLERVRHVSRGYVVVRSVVTLETEDRGYFLAPAPWWQLGCRFTRAWLLELLTDSGCRVVAEARAELPGSQSLRDRASSFFLYRVA